VTPAYNPGVLEEVECHSSSAYGDRPIAFYWEGKRLAVTEIEARWRLPNGRRFRVRAEDSRIFELHYDEPNDEWHIHVP
jgi:hypothetical protein